MKVVYCSHHLSPSGQIPYSLFLLTILVQILTLILILQVIPQDIDWIVSRAAQRGYSIPAAFMSSKPRAGINHKEYGVTSEGVNVFLDTALRRALGIDPTTTPFTIKMTGGPDALT